MAERHDPTPTEMREDLQRWMTTQGTWRMRELLTLHLLAHAEVTRSLEAIAGLRRLYESRP